MIFVFKTLPQTNKYKYNKYAQLNLSLSHPLFFYQYIDHCVVAYCDQWYVKYGEKDWQARIMNHIKSENFNSYNPSILKAFVEAIEWLKEWAVSRNFGAGTRVPWDPQFLIESLSDSTIYMAYYTIAHQLQGDIEGTKPGPLGIEAKQLTPEVFDYIFLDKEYKQEFGIPEEKLATLRKEFNYWYPLDLRVSGKDLVRNHLTMSLYNHAVSLKNSMEEFLLVCRHIFRE